MFVFINPHKHFQTLSDASLIFVRKVKQLFNAF